MFILKHLGESDLLQFQSKVQGWFLPFYLTSVSETYILLTERRGVCVGGVPYYFEKYASKKVALSSSLQEIWHINRAPQ